MPEKRLFTIFFQTVHESSMIASVDDEQAAWEVARAVAALTNRQVLGVSETTEEQHL